MNGTRRSLLAIWIAFLCCLSCWCWISQAQSWVSINIGEPKDIISLDSNTLLIVSTQGVISKVSQSSGELCIYVHSETKQVLVEQLIPLDSVILAFVRIDNVQYAEVFDAELGTLQWNCIVCSNNTVMESRQYPIQIWQILEDTLAILGCQDRIHLYNVRFKQYNYLLLHEFQQPHQQAFELRLRYSPESIVPDLCAIFYSRNDSFLSFSCVPYDDLLSRSKLSISKTACESELYFISTSQCICRRQDQWIVTEEENPESIQNVISWDRDLEILATSLPSQLTFVRWKRNNSIAALRIATPENIYFEELLHSSHVIHCNWWQGKGCFTTEHISNHQSKIQYFEPLTWTAVSWIIDSKYFHADIETFLLPWNKILCYYHSKLEELVCVELTNSEPKVLWKKDLSMTHPVSHKLFSFDSTNCTSNLETSLVSLYEKSIHFLSRMFLPLPFYQMLKSTIHSDPMSSLCSSLGILVTVSRCGTIHAHELDSLGKPNLLWKTCPFEEPICLDRNDSFKIFALENDSIVALWHHRIVLSPDNISSNGYEDCIYYLQVLDKKSLGHHCYSSDVTLQVVSYDNAHLVLFYKNGSIEWDSYLPAKATWKENFHLVALDSNQVTGYELDRQLYRAKYLYRLVLNENERICLVRTAHSKDTKENTVHFSNGTLMHKYLSPQRLLVMTENFLDTQISVYVLDGATGNILFYSHHDNASWPVAGVWTENWFLYSLRNLATLRQEIYVGEILEEPALKTRPGQRDTAAVNDHFPRVYVQGYQVDIWIRDMVVTQTWHSITPKSILLHSLDGFVFVVPKLYFHPRRPNTLVQSDSNSSETLLAHLPYSPNIPLKAVHQQSEPFFVSGVQQVIFSYPDRLRESCTLVISLGLDWTVQLVAPIGQFDSLPESFPRVELILVLLFSVLCLYVVRKWSRNAYIKARWVVPR